MKASSETKQVRRTFKKFYYRGVDLNDLLDMPHDELIKLLPCRARRRMKRGGILRRKQQSFLKKLRKAKKEAVEGERPQAVRTHMRDMLVLPEMIGNCVAVHDGKTFKTIEIKFEMVGHYLGEFAATYKLVKHGRPGIGATHSSRFIPLK